MRKSNIALGITALSLCLVGVSGCNNGATTEVVNETLEVKEETVSSIKEQTEESKENLENSVNEVEDALEDELEDELKDELLTGVKVTTTHRTYSDSARSRYGAVECSAVEIDFDERTENKYKELTSAIKMFNSKSIKDLDETFHNLINDYNDYAEELSSENFYTYEDENSVNILRADSKVFSFTSVNYNYTGGAHPNTYEIGHNIEVATGKEIALSDLILNKDKFKDALKQELLSKVDGDSSVFFDLDSSLKEFDFDNQSWVLIPNGIRVIFNHYDIAPYAAGEFEVDLDYNTYKAIIDDKYDSTIDNYIMAWDGYSKVDIDGDNIDEEFKVESDYDINGTCNSKVYLNGNLVADGEYFYDSDYYITRVGDNYFLYSFYQYENDYNGLEGYNLKTGEHVLGESDSEVFYSKPIEWIGFTESNNETGVSEYKESYYAIVNPDELILGSFDDILSTYTSTWRCKIKEDGTLERIDEYAKANCSAVIYNIDTLEAEVVDNELKEVGKVNLPENTLFRIRYVNDESIILQEVSEDETEEQDAWNYGDEVFRNLKDINNIGDGKLYKLNYHREEGNWLGIINGVSVDNLFKGMVYAG